MDGRLLAYKPVPDEEVGVRRLQGGCKAVVSGCGDVVCGCRVEEEEEEEEEEG